MDPVGVNVIETAALGRPFQLGMLYDCRTDALVPGLRLWTKDQLEQNTCSYPQTNTVFTVTASDSLVEKSKALNIKGGLKLSVFCGLIEVKGAASYLKDIKHSFKQQRLTLHYHSSTKFEELTINHSTSGDVLHYDDDVATHVVTAVLYGADACFVFDREVSSDEDKNTVAGEVKVALKKLQGISGGAKIDLNDSQKTALQKFSCKFYGDFQLPSNPTTFESAVKVFEDLPNLLGENNERVVPLRVYLYPLDKLFSRVVKFQHDISISLTTDIESVMESLNTTEMKCSDLLTDSPALTFKAFQDKINDMKQNCYKYKLSLMRQLGSLLPKIRGKFIEDKALIDLLLEHEESPFKEKNLMDWITVKEKEMNTIDEFLQQLLESGAEVNESLDSCLSDVDVKNLLCFTFTSLEQTDLMLSEMENHMKPQMMRNLQKTREGSSQTWLTGDIRKKMREQLKIFKALMKTHDSKSTKFMVSSKEMEDHPGSCILLYEDGCDDAVCFSPPSKADRPITEEIRGDQVVLKVSPSCPATVEMKLLYKMKEEKDWKSQPVLKNQRTVTLTDLRSDTEYDFKCAAVGKLNYIIESDVIYLKVIDKNLTRTLESVIENLILTENKCSELLKNAKSTTFSALHQKIKLMRKYCQTHREDFNKQMTSIIKSVQACDEESCVLTDLLQAHEESPFKKENLMDWITAKEKEMNTIDEFLQQLLESGVEVNESLDSCLSDVDVKNLLCFTFTSLEQTDLMLSDMENHMKPQMMRNLQKTREGSSQTWLTVNIREKMREQLKIFKVLMKTHDSKSTKFMVSSKDHEDHPGSCILLYEDGCDDAVCFSPPSKPDRPITEEIRCDQVVLKVSPSCPATVEMKLLYKMKEEKDWKSQPVQKNQRTVTLTDLRSDTEYDFKCAAVGKLNYTIESDVMRVVTQGNMLRQSSDKKLSKFIKKSILIEDGNPARYRLQTSDNLNESGAYRKITFGERDPKKPHKTLLMVGKTGTGKSSLINTVMNYTCGVKREDKIWFEITDDHCKLSQMYTQTSIITVYGVYIQESSLDLTIIDTPGYGDTRGIELHKKIAEGLRFLCTSDVVHEINVVCLVIKADQHLLSGRLQYTFDAVQCLFGKDVKENIVLLFTHSDGLLPKNALTAVKEAEVKCAVDEENQPIYFLFDNRQSERFDEEDQIIQDWSWDLSFRGMAELFNFLDLIIPKTLEMTKHVLLKRKQLETKISSLQSHVPKIKRKQDELKKAQDDLEKHKRENKSFEFTVSYRVKVDIDPAVANMATCCSVCEENCHYPGCWWICDLKGCHVMRNNHCTVCTNKCHISKHMKEDKIYVTKTKTEQRINEDLKKKYEDKIKESLSEIKLKEELQELEKLKIQLLIEAYYCVETLDVIALNTYSLFIRQHIDFLIEKIQEINDPEKAKNLEDIKKKAEK